MEEGMCPQWRNSMWKVRGRCVAIPPSAGDSAEPVSFRGLQFQVTEYPTQNGLNNNGAFYDV